MKKITLNRIFFLNVEVGIRKINAAFNKIHDKVHVRANNVTCSLRSSCYICEEIRTRVTGQGTSLTEIVVYKMNLDEI